MKKTGRGVGSTLIIILLLLMATVWIATLNNKQQGYRWDEFEAECKEELGRWLYLYHAFK